MSRQNSKYCKDNRWDFDFIEKISVKFCYVNNAFFTFVGRKKDSIRTKSRHHFFLQVPVVQTMDRAIPRINQYPLDSIIGFAITYPLDIDLSGR